jgi:drug/metabolite transporter (DMT)-like permease
MPLSIRHGSDDRSGFLLALAGFALLSCGDAVVKSMAGQWSPIAVAALRFTIGAVGLSALLWRFEGIGGFRPQRPWLQVLRGVCMAGATLCFFSAIFVMPLAEAMALSFISPILTALLSGPVLGERVRPIVWIASAVALAGVMLVLRPNLADLGAVALLPIASAAFFSVMVIANRLVAGQGSALSMQVFLACVAAPVLALAAWAGHASGLPALTVGPLEWSVVARCALVAVSASTAHWLVYLGTTRAGAATIAPTSYIQLPVAATLGWLFFGDTPDAITLLGGAIIVGAGLALWWLTPKAAPRAVFEAD